jgi:hypothetical protein
MVATFHADLTVSRDSMVPELIDPLVREGARRAGFPSQDVETLVAAVEQAATAIMQRAGPGRVAVSLDRVWGVGKIQLLQCGATSPIQIHQALRDLMDITGVEVVYLDLPLAQPGAPELCVAAEKEGFFFGGVAPLFARDGDALRMQYLNVDYDPSLVQVASPLGQDLVAYAANERQRVMAARGGSDVLRGPE